MPASTRALPATKGPSRARPAARRPAARRTRAPGTRTPPVAKPRSSLERRSAIQSLALQGRPYQLVYSSSSLAGQIAAVESGLAVAALTQCSAPMHLQILGPEHGLGPMEPMQVAVYRSR